MEFCRLNTVFSAPTLARNCTRPDSPQHINTRTLISAQLLVPQRHFPVLRGTHDRGTWALPRQEVVSRTGPRDRTADCEPKLALALSLSLETGEPVLPKGLGTGRGARGNLPVGRGDPSHPHSHIPAVLKHSHQIGHRGWLLLTRPLHPAGLQGGPQLLLKQEGRPPASTLSHPPPGGHRWVRTSQNLLLSFPRAQQAGSRLQSEEGGSGPRATTLKGKVPVLPTEGGACVGPTRPSWGLIFFFGGTPVPEATLRGQRAQRQFLGLGPWPASRPECLWLTILSLSQGPVDFTWSFLNNFSAPDPAHCFKETTSFIKNKSPTCEEMAGRSPVELPPPHWGSHLNGCVSTSLSQGRELSSLKL